jgi:HK97 family phage major capsid protein
MSDKSIKSIATDTYGGYAVVFSDADHPDLEGDFFTAETDFWEHLPTSVVCFDHGTTPLPDDIQDALDRNPRDDAEFNQFVQEATEAKSTSRYVIGQVTKREKTAEGIWLEFIMTSRDEYVERVKAMIDEGIVSYSSDSVAHYVQRKSVKPGVSWVKSWPIPMASTTYRPAMHYGTDVTQTKNYLSLNDMKALGLEVSALEAARDAGKGKHNNKQGNQQMDITYNAHVVAGLVGSILSNPALKGVNWKEVTDEILEDAPVDGEAKDESEVVGVLRPAAELLAQVSGGTYEEAMAHILAYAMQQASATTDAAANLDEEGAYEVEEVAMMNSAGKSFDHAAFKKALVQNRGAYKSGGITIISKEKATPFSLVRTIRAQRDHDGDYLRRHQASVVKQYKALGINPDSAGGFLVPPEYSSEVIEFLRAEATVFPLCRQMPMSSDVLNIPKQTGAATSQWIGENSTISQSQETFGQVTLIAKKLAVLVPISNELLEDSDPSVDAVVREDITAELAEAIDSAILAGAGVGNVPLGIYTIPGVTKTASSTPTNYSDLVAMIARIKNANVRQGNWGWVGDPDAEAILRELQDPAGHYIWTSSVGIGNQAVDNAPDRLLGYPFRYTTLASGPSDDENPSRLFFGDWSDAVVGMRKSLSIVASSEAGTAFAADQTWIRAIMRMDFVMRYDQSMQVLTGLNAEEV